MNRIRNFISFVEKKWENEHFRDLFKGSVFSFTAKIIGMTAGYFFTLIVTRTIGAEKWGIFTLCLTILGVFSIIARLGLDTYIMRFVAQHSFKQEFGIIRYIFRKILSLIVPLMLLLMILFFFSAPLIAEKIFRKPYLTDDFRIISLALLPFVISIIHAEALRGRKDLIAYSVYQYGAKFLLALLFFLAATRYFHGAQAVIVAFVAAIFCIAVICIIHWRKSPVYTTALTEQKNYPFSYKSMLSASMPMFFSSSIMFIMAWTDVILLGVYRTESEIGVYNVALKIASVMSLPLSAINSISAPKFAEFYSKGDMPGLGMMVRQSAKLIFGVSFPLLCLFLIFPEFLLGLFGKEFIMAGAVFLILAFAQFINAFCGSVGLLLQMSGKQKVFQNIVAVSCLLNILVNLALIPRIGIMGAAIAYLVSMSFWNIAGVVYIKKTFGILTIYIPFKRKLIKR